MDPNTQNQGNPYEFITNPSSAPKPNPVAGGGFLMKMVLIIGIGGIIMIILYVVSTGLGGGTSAGTFKNLAQQQNELARVAAIGANGARNQKVRNFGANASMTYQSDVINVMGYLQTKGEKMSTKDLGRKRNPENDELLTTARNASELDQVFMKIMQSETKAYQAALQAAHRDSKNEEAKTLLNKLYGESQLLIEQSNLPY